MRLTASCELHAWLVCCLTLVFLAAGASSSRLADSCIAGGMAPHVTAERRLRARQAMAVHQTLCCAVLCLAAAPCSVHLCTGTTDGQDRRRASMKRGITAVCAATMQGFGDCWALGHCLAA